MFKNGTCPTYRMKAAAPPTTVIRATAMAPAFEDANANLMGVAALVLVLAELVVALPAELIVAGLVVVGVVESPVVVVALTVKPVAVTGTLVLEDEGAVAADADEPDTEEEEIGPTEKVPLVAKTSLMLPMFTASMVYPGPTGTMPSSKVIVPSEGSTLLATAKASLNAWFTSSREKVDGSPAAEVQVTVSWPPDVASVGVSNVRALMQGTARNKRLSFENIF